mgnify:CR=1 FL=1|jgi:hypothetical protein
MKITRSQLRKVINEYLDSNTLTEVTVDGFDFHDSLEKKIWQDESTIDPVVHESLTNIIESFVDSLPVEMPDYDIRLTGSIANYNWSKYSDIDLHVQTDFKKIDDDIELVRAYFNSVTALWNLRHDIKIKGYEVEIYVENVGEEHVSSGVYSLTSDNWITQPVKEQEHEIDVKAVKKKARNISDQIEALLKVQDPKEVLNLSERIKEKIRRMRKSGLRTKKNQYSTGNIAFKVLRRNGSLEKLSTIKNDAYDASMSIKESDSGT